LNAQPHHSENVRSHTDLSLSSDRFSGKDVQLVSTCEMACFMDLRNK